MTKTNKQLMIASQHLRVLLFGIKNMILGTCVFALLFFSIFGFTVVAGEEGYAAVFDFILSCFMLGGSVASMYLLGVSQKRRGGRYVEK